MTEEIKKDVSIPAKELVTLLGIIQLVSSRGVFRPEEFVDVGNAYNKLYEFLADLNVINKPNSSVQSSKE